MNRPILLAISCLLVPGAVFSEQRPEQLRVVSAAKPAAEHSVAAPGTVGSNTTLTLGGKVDLHILGSPTLTTPDGVVYRLVGEQASTIEQLKRIDDKVIVVAGQVLEDEGEPSLHLSVLSFWVVGTSSAIGAIPAGATGEAAQVTPSLTVRGALGTKLIGKPDLTTPDGTIYKLIGPQVATLEELKGLDKGLIEINGQLISNDGRMDIVVMSFRLLNTAGGPDGRGAIGTALPNDGAFSSAMEPSVTFEGVLSTSMIGQPDLRTSEGKLYRLIGPEVSVIGATEGIDGKTVTATGQVITNGKHENLVVSSFAVLSPQPAPPPARQHPAPLLNPATGAPPVAAPADVQNAPLATPKL